MDYQIKGKLAFVTAGAHGIGEAIANLLTQEGAVVIVADQDAAALRERTGWKGTIATDLSSAQGVADAVAHVLQVFGRAPDILVNNLGLADPVPFEDLSDERWARSFDINLMGMCADLPHPAAVDGEAQLGIGDQHCVGFGEAAGVVTDGLRRV